MGCGKSFIKCSKCALGDLCYPLGLTDQDLAFLDQLEVRHNSLEKGECLVQQGQEFEILYMVKTGSLKSTVKSVQGKEQITGFYLPGELIGLDAVSSRKYIGTVQALEQVYICEVNFNQLFEISSGLPNLQRRLMDLMSNKAASEFSLPLNSSARARVAHFLSGLSVRYQRRGLNHYEFDLTMKREDIAEYLGLATETVSRMLSAFQSEELLDISYRHIKLKRLEKLQTYAAELV